MNPLLINKSQTVQCLTMQEAAVLLNVFCSYLMSMLDDGELSYREEEGKKVLDRQEVMQYSERIHAERMKALDELVAQAQELDMGY